MTQSRRAPIRTAAAAGLAAACALGLVGCGDDTAGTETGASVEEVQEEAGGDGAAGQPYDGPYDEDFAADTESYENERVTLSAAIEEVLSPYALTIGGAEGSEVEPLLVLTDEEVPGASPALNAQVTGIVHEGFDLPSVEGGLGVDLDDQAFAAWDGRPYLVADEINLFQTPDE